METAANGQDSMHLALLFCETYSSQRNVIGSHYPVSGTDLGQRRKYPVSQASVTRLDTM